MAKNKSEKSPYQSRFGAGWISPAQWLAENMCSRKSRAENGGELPPRFWNDEYWEKQLRLQLKHANDLLKEFDMAVILTALKHPDAKRVYSLGLKSVLIPLMRRGQGIKNLQEEQRKTVNTEPLPKVDITQKPRQPFARQKSTLQRLRELDDGR